MCSFFCNRKRNSIKVLCYDKNGFILAQKTLVDTEKMKFQWPRNSKELKNITKQQLGWLLSGLKVEQKNSFKEKANRPAIALEYIRHHDEHPLLNFKYFKILLVLTLRCVHLSAFMY